MPRKRTNQERIVYRVGPVFAGTCAGFRSSAIPHFRQSPGLSETTPSHIGRKYAAVGAAVIV